MRLVFFDRATGRLWETSAELARTPYDRVRGLSGRTPAQATPMLFAFPQDTRAPFTATFMLFAIDVLFLDADRRPVCCLHDVPPGRELISCPAPYRYVLELPGGWLRARGLRAPLLGVGWDPKALPEPL